MVSDPSNEYPVYSERNRDNEYFNRHDEMGGRSRRRRLTTGRKFFNRKLNSSINLGKKIVIIISSIIGGIILIGLISCLIIYLRRNKKSIDIKLDFNIKLTFFLYSSIVKVSSIIDIRV
jgi:hypothetical protein